MGTLKQIGKTGVMLNKDLKDVTDPALKKALENILGGKLQTKGKTKGKTKSQVEKLFKKKTKDIG